MAPRRLSSRPRWAGATLFLSFLCMLPAHAALAPANMRAVVDGLIEPLMRKQGIPGMAVGIVAKGRVQTFTYGQASAMPGVPVTDSTLFEIGSVSKTFTATLAAAGQAEGRLSLDATPGAYLPALRGSPIDGVTLLQLGTYTAGGLPLQFPDTVKDADAVIAYYRTWMPSAAPGARRLYSNPSPGLLGLATAAAFQEDFATAMTARIFKPLGMVHSYIRVPEHAMADYAWGHRDGKQVRVNPGPLDAETYGIKTNVRDLLRFVQANIAPDALPPVLRDAVKATQVGHVRAGPLVQGLGWEQFAYPLSREWLLGGNAAEMLFESQPSLTVDDPLAGDERLFGKTGSTGGFGAYVAFVPSRGIGVVLLANRNYPIPVRVETAWAILEALVPQQE